MTWRFDAGALRLMLNFGNVAVEYGLFPGDRLVWASPAAAVGEGAAALPPWSGVVLRGA